jgi:hypothetical protein
MLWLAAGAGTGAWILGRLEARREVRAAAVLAARAERAARPDEQAAPLFAACCERWYVSRGAEHTRTCPIVVEEVDS